MPAATNRAAFGKRGTLALVIFAVLAFVAFLFLVGQGGLSGSDNNGRAHAAGTGLTGFAALTRLLEAEGTPVIRSRDRGAMNTPGLLVLTPPHEIDTDELADIVDRRRTIGPTMIIAPKWRAIPLGDAADQPGWVALFGTSGTFEMEIDGRTITLEDEVAQRRPEWQGLGKRGSLPHEALFMAVDPDETEARLVAPVVIDRERRILAGYLQDDGSFMSGDLYLDPERGDGQPVYNVVIVAEPDLLNNWGLADPTRAALASDIVALARQGTEAPVRFDMTLNGLGASRNLLTLAFEPPFLAATLTLLLALAIAMWRAFARFGPALRPAPAIRPGKSQLVANGADVIARSGRMHLLRGPYADLLGRRIAHRLGVHERPDQPIEEILRERDETDAALAIEDLRDARGASQTLRAARALRDLERTS